MRSAPPFGLGIDHDHHDVDALFKTVAQDALVIPIFRDFVLNIHVEVM